MDFRKILEDQFRLNGYPVIADGIVSGRMAMVDEIECMKKVREATIEECAAVADEWYRQFAGTNPKYVSAGEFARDAVTDIADEIRTLRTNHL